MATLVKKVQKQSAKVMGTFLGFFFLLGSCRLDFLSSRLLPYRLCSSRLLSSLGSCRSLGICRLSALVVSALVVFALVVVSALVVSRLLYPWKRSSS